MINHKKIFISQPMNGLTENEIKKARMEAEQKIFDYNVNNGFNGVIEFIDTLHNTPPEVELSDYGNRLWYLGQSIQALGTADEAYFIGKWSHANGCCIEMDCCQRYGIPCKIIVDTEIIDSDAPGSILRPFNLSDV